jgi:hypothetical protein
MPGAQNARGARSEHKNSSQKSNEPFKVPRFRIGNVHFFPPCKSGRGTLP